MEIQDKKDIRKFSEEELIKNLEALGEKAFRAKQVHEWLWQKGVHQFDEMTNLSKDLREKLKENFVINAVTIAHSQISKDNTIKLAFRLYDGKLVEGVLIPTSTRATACVSSQVGCSLDCKFCATGFMKRERNLEPAEIFDQVVLIDRLSKEKYDIPLSNIVFMGMGEPLLNYKNVMEGIDRITSPTGLGMSPQRITVSTAGIVKMIRKMADEEVRFNLALSLHAANNEKRSAIMPINETNPLEELAESLAYFVEKTGTRPTLEYCVINDINDNPNEAEELVTFARKFPCKINLIEYNPIDMADFRGSSADKVQDFADYLEKKKLIVNIRRSRGKDIDAACGQLANKLK